MGIRYKTSTFYWLTVAPTILSLLVMLGWKLDIRVLIQVLPNLAPMQFNTALCFFLSALGLISAWRLGFSLTLICGVVVALISTLSLIQYFFAINLGIDQLFHHHQVTTLTTYPGRMSPNTAVTFLLLGLVLLMESALWDELYLKFRYWILGGAIIALGLTSITGYVLNVPTAIGWAHSGMAIHSSAGFLFLGVAVLILGFARISRFEIKQYILGRACVVFMLAGSLPLFCAEYSVYEQLNNYKKEITSDLKGASERFNKDLNAFAVNTQEQLIELASLDTGEKISVHLGSYIAKNPFVELASLYKTEEVENIVEIQFLFTSRRDGDDGMDISRTMQTVHTNILKKYSETNKIFVDDGNLIFFNVVKRNGEHYNLITVIRTERLLKLWLPRFLLDNFSNEIRESWEHQALQDRWLGLPLGQPITIADWQGYLVVSDTDLTSIRHTGLWWVIWVVGLVNAVGSSVLTYLLLARRIDRQHLEEVQNATTSGLIKVNKEGVILSANKEANRIFKYQPGGLIGRSVEDLVSIDSIQHENFRHDFYTEKINRRMGHGVFYGRTSDGGNVPVSVDLNFVTSTVEQQVLATVVDLTERQFVVERLQSQNLIFEQLTAFIDLPIIKVNQNGVMWGANQQVTKMLNRLPTALEGQSVYGVLLSDKSGDAGGKDQTGLANTLEDGFARKVENQYCETDDGQGLLLTYLSVPIIADSQVTGAIMIVLEYERDGDITNISNMKEQVLKGHYTTSSGVMGI